MTHNFQIEGPYIELIGLLKAMGIAETGGQAKAIVDEGLVLRNGQQELRKRAKLVPGDLIQIEAIQIKLQ
jgi:ribosome-associated protein